MADKNILVVEDESDIASTLQLILTMEGHNVLLSYNGKEALEELNRGYKPDLIISDIMMPIMNGYDFISELRKNDRFKNIPLIFTSAAKLDQTKLIADSWQGFIRKPFDLDEFIKEVSSFVK